MKKKTDPEQVEETLADTSPTDPKILQKRLDDTVLRHNNLANQIRAAEVERERLAGEVRVIAQLLEQIKEQTRKIEEKVVKE
jgi:hypothetical protein